MISIPIKICTVNDAVIFVAKATEYKDDVDYSCHKYVVNAKSFMGVLSIGLYIPCIVTLHSDDEDLQKKFADDMALWKIEDEE